MEPTSTSPSDDGAPGTTPSPASDRSEVERFEAVWREHHRHLEYLATRILGDRAAAEDITQDAFSRLMDTELDEIRDVRGWLTVVVRRLCLNRLRSAYSRREAATETGPLEQVATAPTPSTPVNPHGAGGDPADRLTLDDQVRAAVSVVLDELTPPERTAFVLHDVFGLPHAAVGQIVGRTPAACRQLASRARRSVQATAPERDGPVQLSSDGARVVDQFLAACSHGNLDRLLTMLDPNVTGEAVTPEGELVGEFTGNRPVARNLLSRFGPGTGAEFVQVPIEDRLGVVIVLDGRVFATVTLTVADGLIQHLRAVLLVGSD